MGRINLTSAFLVFALFLPFGCQKEDVEAVAVTTIIEMPTTHDGFGGRIPSSVYFRAKQTFDSRLARDFPKHFAGLVSYLSPGASKDVLIVVTAHPITDADKAMLTQRIVGALRERVEDWMAAEERKPYIDMEPNQSTDPTLASGTPLAGPEARHP